MTRVPAPINTFVMPRWVSKRYEKYVNNDVQGRLETLMETRTDPIETQRQRQLTLLQDLLAHAKQHVPYYREKYDSVSTELDSLSELSTIPPLKKDEVKQNADRLVSEAYDTSTLHKEFTSGSTGKPLRIYVDDEAVAWKRAHQLRHYREMGYEPGDKIAVIWGEGQYFRMKEFKDTVDNVFRNKRELRTFELSEEEVRKYSRFLNEFDPDIIESYPSAMVLLCEVIENERLSVSPKAVQTASEMLSDRERSYIESVLDAPVYNKFGASEVGPVAMTCHTQDGMHINTESIIVETDGEGRLLVTNLRNHAMPMIRYRVGDVVKLADDGGEACSCGSNLPKIHKVRGKTNDLVVTTNDTYLDPYFFVDLMDRGPDVETFKITQRKDRSVEIMIVSDGEIGAVNEHVTTEIADIDDDLEVTVKFVEDVPETEGWKRRYVMSEVSEETWDA